MHNRPKPRPGSLPLLKYDAEPTPHLTPAEPWWKTPSPEGTEVDPLIKEAFEQDIRRRDVEANFTALQKARTRVEELAGAARDAAFDDWVRRCVVSAEIPSEWTQARVLHENYLAHAQRYGRTREQRAQSVLALATETQWGRMMATVFPKKRRASGWYYPLRCKQVR